MVSKVVANQPSPFSHVLQMAHITCRDQEGSTELLYCLKRKTASAVGDMCTRDHDERSEGK